MGNTTLLIIGGYVLLFTTGFLGLQHIFTRRWGRLIAYVSLFFGFLIFSSTFLSFIIFGILSLMWFYDLFTLPSQIRRGHRVRRAATVNVRRSVRRVTSAMERTTPTPQDVPPIISNPIPEPNDDISGSSRKKKKRKRKSRFAIIDEEIED